MKTKCAYEGLTAIVTDSVPHKKFLESFGPKDLRKVVNYYLSKTYDVPLSSGVATVFWGMGNLLAYAMIQDLETGEAYVPEFNMRDGVFTPSIPLCNRLMCSGVLNEQQQKNAAMRELLMQSLGYLKGGRQRRYFILTPYEKGCCPFGEVVIQASLREIEDMITWRGTSKWEGGVKK
ncbi:MAG: hypothetical protein U9M95_02490 [Candidatus Altiarchaeota archaeon]|nr:hypothetical protein [Candidatus Altiarchaeota archaeon]